MKVQVKPDKLQDWIDNNTKTGDCITTTELDSGLIEIEFNPQPYEKVRSKS